MNILITGNQGFIGTQVELQLHSQGCHTIDGMDSLEPQVHGSSERRLRAGERGFLHQSYDCVVHLAAKVGVGQSMYDPVDYVACNSLDTAALLQHLTNYKPKRLVVASSMSIYGEGDEFAGVTETRAPDLRSIYALTKYDQEQLCLIWGQMYNVEVVALRFFNVYGPGQALTNPYTGAMAIFATRLLNGKAPMVNEDGQQTRDFVYVDDVASAVVRAATTALPAGVYNVGNGVPHTIEDVAESLAAALDIPIAPNITRQVRKGDIRHCWANASKLKWEGWQPKVGFEEGLARYAKWLKTQPIPVDKFDQAASEAKAAGLLK